MIYVKYRDAVEKMQKICLFRPSNDRRYKAWKYHSPSNIYKHNPPWPSGKGSIVGKVIHSIGTSSEYSSVHNGMEQRIAIGGCPMNKDQQTYCHHHPGQKSWDNECVSSHKMSHVLAEKGAHDELEPYKINSNHAHKSNTKEFERKKRRKCHVCL